MNTDPSTVVGLDSVLKKIQTNKLGDHSNCIEKFSLSWRGTTRTSVKMAVPHSISAALCLTHYPQDLSNCSKISFGELQTTLSLALVRM